MPSTFRVNFVEIRQPANTTGMVRMIRGKSTSLVWIILTNLV
jgi:hypothetical protein